MTTATILFGTETGNAEMAADEISSVLSEVGISSAVHSMEDYPVADLQGQQMVVVVTSTYGEGELPDTAIPFYDALTEQRPDLSSTRFAAFGLGDSSYDTYNQGITTLVTALVDLGATQIGETGKHDADTGLDAFEGAVAWARDTFSAARV